MTLLRSQPIGPIVADVAAPARLVYQMVAAIGQGPQRPGERAEIVERDGDRLLADFWTVVSLPAGRQHSVRTREVVHLRPSDRVEYEHLDGPARGLRESITIERVSDRQCRLVYAGSYPGAGSLRRLLFRLLTRPAIERVMKVHFQDLRERAELRAARSREFAVASTDELELPSKEPTVGMGLP